MIVSDAVFSKDRIHRYTLVRVWDEEKPSIMIMGLNPSTADETKNDPTVRRFIGFAKKWGYGSLYVTNMFAFRATYPEDLYKAEDPVGPENDYWIRKISSIADLVVLAYGNHGAYRNRHEEILKMVKNPYCIKITKMNLPIHPLYTGYTEEPIPFLVEK